MSFRHNPAKNGPEGQIGPVDELPFFRRHALYNYLLLSFAGGLLFAAALPPLNLWFLGFFALAPLVWCASQLGWGKAALCGWMWGLGWALFAFQFLREIEWIVPYLLAPVIGIWPAVSGALISCVGRNLLYPAKIQAEPFETRKNWLKARVPWYRVLLFVLASAVIYTLVEWTRSRLFTWNDLSVTQWRNLLLIQICSVTGSYGVLFLVALTGSAAAALPFRKGWFIFLGVLFLLFANHVWGFMQKETIPSRFPKDRKWRPLLIQGDLSQRRHAGEEQFREALKVYTELTAAAAKKFPKADVIVWPESAVPVPLRSAHPWSREYAAAVQQLIADSRKPMLIGTLDFAFPLPREAAPGFTNSALYFDKEGTLRYKYDKIHRVPYGEYIPFRKYLPEFLIKMVDMGRDLTPGVNWTPLAIPDGPRVSVAICYEGVFGYLTREFARQGANVLLVLSNDAWYPRSSEPEQHLANAVMRAVETGLPMVRCGNNGGSLLVWPSGFVSQGLRAFGGDVTKRVYLQRGRSCGIVEVPYFDAPEPTFYVKHGEWLIGVFFVFFFAFCGAAAANHLKFRKLLPSPSKRR